MKKLLCKLGIHDWGGITANYERVANLFEGHFVQISYRKCSQCKKKIYIQVPKNYRMLNNKCYYLIPNTIWIK